MYWPTLRRARVCFAFTLAIALPSAAIAQTPMKSREASIPSRVAVIDMQRLLQYHPFVQRLEQLRESEEQANSRIVDLEEELLDLSEMLDRFKEDTPHSLKIMEATIDKEVEIAAAKRKLRHRYDAYQAQLYVAYFRVVQKHIELYARENKIGLVLNRAAIKTDADNEPSAQALFGQKVVYERKIDITNDILDRFESNVLDELPKFESDDKDAN